jgi:menaquinone-dependent protoporphyrinogen oxidase
MRILVAYGSTHGATAELATAIAEELSARGFPADVENAATVTDLAGYDAAVVGGSLYWDRWQPDARGLVERCAEQLRTMPVWLFSSGPTDGSAAGGSLAPVPEVQRLARDIDIAGHTTFGGLMKVAPGRLVRNFTPATRAGDFRDRDQVTEWVARIAKGLRAHVTEGLPQPRDTDLSAVERAGARPDADTLLGQDSTGR